MSAVVPHAFSGPILVVGASGNVGNAVVRSLLASGLPVRAAGTNPERLAAKMRAADLPGGECIRLDLRDAATFPAAVDGVAGVFLVRPPAIADVRRTLNPLIDAARRAGVGHIVFSSVTGADRNRIVPHHRVEEHLRRSGVSWTVLRPGFFAQNLADAYRHDIVNDDRIILPAGRGRAAFIDVRDIGDVAAVVFADPAAHRGAGYVLTGPRAIDFAEVASLLSLAEGRTITYQPVSVQRYVRHVHRQGAPLPQAVVQAILHAGLRRGQAEAVDPTLPRLLGRPASNLEDYVRARADLWAHL